MIYLPWKHVPVQCITRWESIFRSRCVNLSKTVIFVMMCSLSWDSNEKIATETHPREVLSCLFLQVDMHSFGLRT